MADQKKTGTTEAEAAEKMRRGEIDNYAVVPGKGVQIKKDGMWGPVKK